MSRFDMAGLFWDDTPPPKPPKKEKVKRNPPHRFWEADDYLPNLDEARRLNARLFTDTELVTESHAKNKEPLVFDIECYPDYFLIAFTGLRTRRVIFFEMYGDLILDTSKLYWVMTNFCVLGFNSRNYDIPIASLAINGAPNEVLHQANKMIIEDKIWSSQVLKHFKVKALECDHIDIIEVAPLIASLKLYGGRIHTERMQDLPFPPGSYLNNDQRTIVR